MFGDVAQRFLQNTEEAERDILSDLLRGNICATAFNWDPVLSSEVPAKRSDSERKP
jgi:hypothetical protein